MTIPDPATIAEQVVAIEAEKHRFGWDRDPSLHLLYQGPNGPASYVAIKDWPKGQAGEQIERLSLGMEAGLKTRLWRYSVQRLRALAPGCYATAFVTEAWMADKEAMTPREWADYSAGIGPRLADRVGSVEVRTAYGFDLEGNGYFYVRVRGKQPEPVDIQQAVTGTGVTGRIPEALARILAVVAGESVEQHVARARIPDWLGGGEQP